MTVLPQSSTRFDAAGFPLRNNELLRNLVVNSRAVLHCYTRNKGDCIRNLQMDIVPPLRGGACDRIQLAGVAWRGIFIVFQALSSFPVETPPRPPLLIPFLSYSLDQTWGFSIGLSAWGAD
jgi:hypothetical protein